MIVMRALLICNGCGETFGTGDGCESTAKEVRSEAKQEGWVHNNGSDLCENCKNAS